MPQGRRPLGHGRRRPGDGEPGAPDPAEPAEPRPVELYTAVQAKRHGIHTAALVGGKRGRLAELADEAIVIDSHHYGRVEDAHMAVCHMLCYAFMELPDLAR